MAYEFVSVYQISSKPHSGRDVMSYHFFQNGSLSIKYLLLDSGLPMSLIYNGQNLFARKSENKWLSFWNSISSFDFDRLIVIRIPHVIVHWPTKFHPNWTIHTFPDGVWPHGDFSALFVPAVLSRCCCQTVLFNCITVTPLVVLAVAIAIQNTDWLTGFQYAKKKLNDKKQEKLWLLYEK